MAEFSLRKALKAIHDRNVDAENIAVPARIDPDTPQNRIARARQNEQSLVEQLAYLQKEPQTQIVKTRLHNIMDRLGELAAEQGDYERAATISVSPERRRHYKEITKAIRRKDSQNCQCEPDLVVDRVNKEEFRSPAIMTVDKIVHNGRMLNLDKCRRCGFQNAR